MLLPHDEKRLWTVSLFPANGIVRKEWTTPLHGREWLYHHVDILEKIVPDYVVSFGLTEVGSYIEYKFIEGITLVDWTRRQTNLDSVRRKWYEVAQFWIDSIKKTLPYAHWDWTTGNTILCDDGSLKMIDWDQCRVATHSEIRDRFIYRLERERKSVLAAYPELDEDFTELKLDIMSYFDKILIPDANDLPSIVPITRLD